MEHYVLAVNGVEVSDRAERRADVLRHALARMEGDVRAVEVAIADSRTLSVCACWTRCVGKEWQLRGSLLGWLH